jgi:hypothetical protein
MVTATLKSVLTPTFSICYLSTHSTASTGVHHQSTVTIRWIQAHTPIAHFTLEAQCPRWNVEEIQSSQDDDQYVHMPVHPQDSCLDPNTTGSGYIRHDFSNDPDHCRLNYHSATEAGRAICIILVSTIRKTNVSLLVENCVVAH